METEVPRTFLFRTPNFFFTTQQSLHRKMTPRKRLHIHPGAPCTSGHLRALAAGPAPVPCSEAPPPARWGRPPRGWPSSTLLFSSAFVTSRSRVNVFPRRSSPGFTELSCRVPLGPLRAPAQPFSVLNRGTQSQTLGLGGWARTAFLGGAPLPRAAASHLRGIASSSLC